MKPAGFLAVLALCTLMLGCGTKQYSTLPDELVGVWNTAAPKYADRYFVLKKDLIIIGTGGGTTSRHIIEHVEKTREGGQTFYTIFYMEDGTRYQWSFYYNPAQGAIQFKHQTPIIWTKKRGS